MKKKKVEKETTITELSNRIEQGFKSSDLKFNHLTQLIDDLASTTATGFSDNQKRFYQIDKRFDQVDKRFDAHDKRFERIENEIKLTRSEISRGLRKIKGIKPQGKPWTPPLKSGR